MCRGLDQEDVECVAMTDPSFPPSQGESPSLDTLRRLIQEEVGKQLESEWLAFVTAGQMRTGALRALGSSPFICLSVLCSLGWKRPLRAARVQIRVEGHLAGWSQPYLTQTPLQSSLCEA